MALFKKKKKEGAEGAEEKAEDAKEEASEAKEEAKEGAEGEAPAEGEEGAPKKGKQKLIIIAAAVLVLALGSIGFMLMGSGDKAEGGHEEAGHEEAAAEVCEKDSHGNEVCKPGVAGPAYYELPEFLVNLNTGGSRVSFLKMSVTLELRDQAAVAVVEANKPRILDTFNTYLREMRPQDVQGSAGIYRLRDELLARINGTVEEGLVKDILFSEIIVQ